MSDLADLVGSEVDAAPDLSDEAKLLVLAALDGDEALADMAGFEPPKPAPLQGQAEAVGAFLQQISVQAFRGIGAMTSLDLKPTPGLTIVAGRNGSGKSSFAEALEVALTGTTYRWSNKGSKRWQGAWRNLHHDDLAPRIKITLAEENVGQTYVTADWQVNSDLRDVSCAVQRHGEKKRLGLDELGWADPLSTFRPMLSYDELGELLAAEPSRLYDMLSRVLGLEQLADAIKRLDERYKALSAPTKAFRDAKGPVTNSLSTSDDERAREALARIKSRTIDTASLRALIAGQEGAGSQEADALRAFLRLTLPTSEEVTGAVNELKAALQAVAMAGNATTEVLDRRAAVLTAAVDLHSHDGDMRCPICGVGELNADRIGDLTSELAEITGALQTLRQARERLNAAERYGRDLVRSVPETLRSPSPEALSSLQASAIEAWRSWSDLPAQPLELAQHLDDHYPRVLGQLRALQLAVEPILAQRDDAWAKVAGDLAALANLADHCQAIEPELRDTKAALDWLKSHDQRLKNQRIKPIADQAITIWAALRQESNVEISGVTLKGTSTHRRVEIDSTVDGRCASGITVLSQGELHALSLALFLPRATTADSPFRFVILDDPVQAMDPSKIDGMLDVLTTIAKERQVIVFSHDDRLTTAARRGGGEATILEVSREAGSVVSVRQTQDPATRYLDDARAMARDKGLPEDTKRRLLPGMLRMALEAQLRDRHFIESIGNGQTPMQVETAWETAVRTGARLALVLSGDPSRDITTWLDKRPYRRRGLGICSSAFHSGLSGDPVGACRDVEDLISDIRSGAR